MSSRTEIKETGLEAALLFLGLNDYQLQDDLVSIFLIKVNPNMTNWFGTPSNEVLLEFVLEVAKAEVSLEECQEWFERNIL
jgi:hypothetical protein